MFDKLNQAAEQMATIAPRRQFLGRLGRGAMTVAAALAGLVALPGNAEAGSRRGCPQGKYPAICRNGTTRCCPRGYHCFTRPDGSTTCRRML